MIRLMKFLGFRRRFELKGHYWIGGDMILNVQPVWRWQGWMA